VRTFFIQNIQPLRKKRTSLSSGTASASTHRTC